MAFIYSESAGLNDSKIGKLATPLKMLIEAESDAQRKKGGALTALFNIEKSNRYGETIQYSDEFTAFMAAAEGTAAETDSIVDTYRKFIEHIPFMKEFVITKQMLDDSVYGIGADAKRRCQNFVRAYYLTMNKIAEAAIANGKNTSMVFNKATVDLATADGVALFSTEHKYGSADSHGTGVQSNYFGMNRYDGNYRDLTLADVEDAITKGAAQIRNMKDENGEVLGYVADTVIIPGNLPLLEKYVKQVLGSPYEASNANNGINIHYGNWNLVVLPTWQYELNEDNLSQTYPIILMSSEANRNLCGNMFFNRVPLSVKNWEDSHTRNWIWNGYCRFGIGFGTYKHIALIECYSSGTEGDQTQI
ncbi:MAG: hypothetical protein IJW46_05360 [Clostridia bacterium]|nr:hypothetical protein [Clostridia bacterium]